MGKLLLPADYSTIVSNSGVEYDDTRAVIKRLRPQQPLYLFDRSQLVETIQIFQSGFPGTLSYAVKANTRNRVLRTLIARGVTHFDVASIVEIKALRMLSPDVYLHYNNPIKPKWAIELAFREYGVRSFALDDARELSKILEVCPHPDQLLLSVRFKLDSHHAAYDFGAKFGADTSVAAELLRQIEDLGAIPALTFHPGSQCTEPGEYRRYIYAAADIAQLAGVELTQLNVGGGFPEYYTNTRAKSRQHYFEMVRSSHEAAFPDKPVRLMCEPGRSMVAPCATLLCKVTHVRPEQRVVFLNDGIYGGLQEQCLADLALPVRCWRGSRRLQHTLVPFTIFGPTCDPVDRLPRTLSLPADICENDYLEFGLMGAYGSATSTRFNGFDSQDYVNVCSGRPLAF